MSGRDHITESFGDRVRAAVELLQAGADAVQVGTATFRDPKAPWRVLRQLARWCAEHGTTVEEIRDRAGWRRTHIAIGSEGSGKP